MDEEFNKKVFLKHLAAHVAKVRKSKGYSQDRLTLESGLARGTVSRIENAQADPQASTLARIAQTIGVPLSKLMDVKI